MSRFDPSSDPQLPPALRRELIRAHNPRIAVPRQIDERILSGARESYRRRQRSWRIFRRFAAAVAAAAVLALVLRIWVFAPKPPAAVAINRPQLSQLADVNHDGRVDILDAYIVARKIARHEPLDPAWDVNGDGVVDQRDVDLIAGLAVQTGQESGK